MVDVRNSRLLQKIRVPAQFYKWAALGLAVAFVASLIASDVLINIAKDTPVGNNANSSYYDNEPGRMGFNLAALAFGLSFASLFFTVIYLIFGKPNDKEQLIFLMLLSGLLGWLAWIFFA